MHESLVGVATGCSQVFAPPLDDPRLRLQPNTMATPLGRGQIR